tara:strand:- start:66 stop:482 length:417 start_codon:yes stop_codon:yes gene_type:complete
MKKLNNKKIKDLIISYKDTPKIDSSDSVYNSILQMNKTGIGIVCIINKKRKLKGIITDGDLRRFIISMNKPLAAFLSENVEKYMNKKPFTVNENYTLSKIVKTMEKKKIWDLPVIDINLNLVGLCHLHKILKKLIKND